MSETVQLLPPGATRLTGFQKEMFTRSSVQVFKEGEDKKVGLVVFKMHKMDREQILPKSIEATW